VSGTGYRWASEVGEYAYCARAWWLHRVVGHAPGDPDRLDQGRRGHAAHGRALARAAALRRLAVWLVFGAGLAFALYGLGWR